MTDFIRLSALLFAFSAVLPISAQPAQNNSDLMTNQRVYELSRIGVHTDEIIRLISTAPQVSFDFTPGALDALSKAGIPDSVIKAMAIRQHGGAQVTSPPLSDAPTGGRPPVSPRVVPSYAVPENTSTVPVRGNRRDDYYGLQLGSVTGYGGGGFSWTSGLGIHPNYSGTISVGLLKYLGLFGQGGYTPLLHEALVCNQLYCTGDVKANLFYVGGGIEGVATNRSRIVPYGKLGVGYGRGAAYVSVSGFSGSASIGAPTLFYGGGLRVYFNQHIGAAADITALRFLGNYGGGTAFVPSFGIFVQSK